MIKERLYILWFVLFCVGTLSAQVEDDFVRSFFRVERELLREKLYIHTDKPYYAAGDTIWFRGTLVNADTHSYLVKSNYIYVELLTKNDSVVSRIKVKRDGLCFHNCLPLSLELADGEYMLRAYSNYMRNFGEDYFFSRSIYISNMLNRIPFAEVVRRDYHVSFMPEGGDLLVGVAQRVAFKAQNSTGFSENVRGSIVTERGDTLAFFSTEHDGMGAFLLNVPEGDVELKASVFAVHDNLHREFILPVAKKESLALRAKLTEDGKLNYRVLCSHGWNPPKDLRLVAHCRGLLLENCSLDSTMGAIDITSYPDGILHLLVCTAEGVVLTRRMIFVGSRVHGNQWAISTDKKVYGKREKVRVDFRLVDAFGKPLRGDFSMSVTDAKIIAPDANMDNIVSNLLVTNDLNGFVENPNWYFIGGTSEEIFKRKYALDLVMLTHGWSRFEIDSLRSSPHYELAYPLEVGQYISGRVSGIPDKERQNMVSAINPAMNEFASAVINEDGTFCIEGLDIPEGECFGLRVLTKRKRGIDIWIEQQDFPVPAKKDNWSKNKWTSQGDSNRTVYLSDRMKMYMLPEVQIASKKSTHKFFKNFFVRGRLGHEELTFYNDPNQVSNSLDLFNRLATERFSGCFFNPNYQSFEEANSMTETEIFSETAWRPSWGPLERLYVGDDEFEGFESISTALTRIHPGDISRIEFLVREEMGKDYSVMILYMNPGFHYQDGIGSDSRRKTIFPLGYCTPAYFYHPTYGIPALDTQRESEDARTTLYWNPSIQTDSNGCGAAIFYTSDYPECYNLVIEGHTFDGNPCRLERLILVGGSLEIDQKNSTD